MTASVAALDDLTFSNTVEINAAGFGLVAFWSPRCVLCLLVGAVMDQVISDFATRVQFARVDVDRSPITGQRWGVRSLPHLTLFWNGAVVGELVGMVRRSDLTTFLDAHMRKSQSVPG